MAKLNAMAPDSAGFKVLMRLYELGGKATIAQLIETLWTEFRSTPRFHQIATKPLAERGLAMLRTTKKSESLEITPEGSLLVQRYTSMLPRRREGSLSSGELNVQKHLRWGDTRPGALDYRSKPSMMGGERVPFRSDEEEKAA